MSWIESPTIGDEVTINGKTWMYTEDGVWERSDFSLDFHSHDRQHAMDSEEDHAPVALEKDKGSIIHANETTGKVEWTKIINGGIFLL